MRQGKRKSQYVTQQLPRSQEYISVVGQQSTQEPLRGGNNYNYANVQPNAFSTLRNQISNLRQEFSKLVQKEDSSQGEIISSQKNQMSSSFVQYRPRPNNQSGPRKSEGNHSKGFFNFKSKTIQSPLTNSPLTSTLNDNIDLVKVDQCMTSSFSNLNNSMNPPGSTVHDLQAENKKLIKNKIILQQQRQKLREEMFCRERQSETKMVGLKAECERWKEIAEQNSMSLDLKNGLIEKLQTALERKREERKRQNQIIHKLEDELTEREKRTKQTLEDKKKQNLEQLQLKSGYQNLMERVTILQKERKDKQQKMSTIQNQNKILQQQNMQLLSKLQQLQKLSNSQTVIPNKVNIDAMTRGKTNEEELIQLRKRVQSYKKSIQNLNSTNNTTRQKLAEARQQIKLLKQQNKKATQGLTHLLEESNLKQKLISSLYRDINVLDSQLRQISQLKGVISCNNRLVDALNFRVMELESKFSNLKYLPQEHS